MMGTWIRAWISNPGSSVCSKIGRPGHGEYFRIFPVEVLGSWKMWFGNFETCQVLPAKLINPSLIELPGLGYRNMVFPTLSSGLATTATKILNAGKAYSRFPPNWCFLLRKWLCLCPVLEFDVPVRMSDRISEWNQPPRKASRVASGFLK